jgi:sensor histidine kinase YesM
LTVLPQIPFCYFILYFVIPTFILPKKYVIGITIFVGSIVVLYWMTHAYFLWTLPHFWAFFGMSEVLLTQSISEVTLWNIMNAFGPLATCSLMCSLKFLKIWYIKQQENTELLRENGKAELQFLKTQVHPHFLFNTLNNIYAFTITKSSIAADLVDRLFGILHYMIHEGQNTLVPLKREIKLIQDYISLEKVRYGDRLNMAINIQGNPEGKFIAPLLMIPFVENSFKHGSSKMLTHPTIQLSIVIEETELTFMLKNNKPNSRTEESQTKFRGGIGLKNTAKRLHLLYPDRHDLKIESTDDTFYVHMHILLKETKEANLEKYQVRATTQPPIYASP